eukprot:snap_masked-scaffold_70-processed-gene-0.5-mRNA-1 protein AED:1.00 eAED:1.00 QI:0/0/0/0/1/1/2/0/207
MLLDKENTSERCVGKNGSFGFEEKVRRNVRGADEEDSEEYSQVSREGIEFLQRAIEYQNALYNKRFKFTPLCFSLGEFVLVSKAVKHKKLRPQWVGLYIVKRQLNEHLYKDAKIMGQTMEVHPPCLIFFFAPSELPQNPRTKVTFLNDSGKLEVQRLRGIKEETGGFLLQVDLRGFGNETDWTWQLLSIMIEDLPKLVIKYLAKEKI